MALFPGTRLGPYEILSALGAGGMGEVYKARDTRLNRSVAIKILLKVLANDPQFRERFDREARITRNGRPSQYRARSTGREKDIDFFVMQSSTARRCRTASKKVRCRSAKR